MLITLIEYPVIQPQPFTHVSLKRAAAEGFPKGGFFMVMFCNRLLIFALLYGPDSLPSAVHAVVIISFYL